MKLRRHHKIYYLGGIVILLATGSFVVRNAVSSAHAGAGLTVPLLSMLQAGPLLALRQMARRLP
jgi:hypothetical protein